MDLKFKDINNTPIINSEEYNNGNYKFIISNNGELKQYRITPTTMKPYYCHMEQRVYGGDSGSLDNVGEIIQAIIDRRPIYFEISSSNGTPYIYPCSFFLTTDIYEGSEEFSLTIEYYDSWGRERKEVWISADQTEIIQNIKENWPYGIQLFIPIDNYHTEAVSRKEKINNEWVNITWEEFINDSNLNYDNMFFINEEYNAIWINDGGTIYGLVDMTLGRVIHPDDKMDETHQYAAEEITNNNPV